MSSINIAYSWKLSQEKTHILLTGTTVRCHTPKFCGKNFSVNSHKISKFAKAFSPKVSCYTVGVLPPPQYYISMFWRPIKSRIWKLSFFWQLKNNGNGRLLTCKLARKVPDEKLVVCNQQAHITFGLIQNYCATNIYSDPLCT